ncbi:hypothetical protein GW17_00000444 [Ensete ventricosum]|nr:hypothetical protein GW17_00000444 [Ensete ventricosum]
MRQRWDEVLSRSYASSTQAGTRRCLVFLRCDEAAPHSPIGRLPSRCCLVLLLESKAGMRRCLVFLHWDEATPRSLAGR